MKVLSIIIHGGVHIQCGNKLKHYLFVLILSCFLCSCVDIGHNLTFEGQSHPFICLSVFTLQNLQHEMHHIWHSRVFGDTFLLHYGLQGIVASIQGRSIVDFILEKNFFESQAYYNHWFNH